MVLLDFWFHLDISQTSLSTCALLEGWGFITGAVQDPARLYGVLGLGPSSKVCMNVALNLCPLSCNVGVALNDKM